MGILFRKVTGVQKTQAVSPERKAVESCACREKPPVGVPPKKFWQKERAIELIRAMFRYTEAQKPVPKAWIQELKDYILELENERLRNP